MRFMTALVSAGLALIAMGGARAQLLTVKPTTVPAAITKTDANGAITVAFQDVAASAPQNAITGFDATFLNYTITSTANPGTGGPGTLTFNDPITLDVLFTDTVSGGTHVSSFAGTVAGTANAVQNHDVRATLTPLTDDFTIAGTPYHVAISLPVFGPTMNVTAPFSVTAHVTGGAIPEPGSMALLGIGILPALSLIRRRR